MATSTLQASHRSMRSSLLSLIYPSKELFHRQRALSHLAVLAGFSSTAGDYIEEHLNLDDHLIQYKESIFFLRVSGDSMCGMSIFAGDLLAVDRAMSATHGCVVIAVVDGEFTVKQLINTASGQVLRAAHPSYPDILIHSEQNLSIWGVVQWSTHHKV